MLEIIFVEDNGLTYAIARGQEYKEMIYEELIFCELEMVNGKNQVRWQDNWTNPEVFDDLQDAKAHILANHDIHAPYNNGKKWPAEIKKEGD